MMPELDPRAAPRVAAAQRALAKASAALLVASDHATVRWLCGHSVTAGTVAVVDSDSVSFVAPGPEEDPSDSLLSTTQFASLRRLSTVAIEMPAAPGRLVQRLARHPLVDLSRELEALRVVKDRAEIDAITVAANRASMAQRIFRAELAAGVTERQLSDRIQARLAEQGNSTAAIVDLMFGERCALIGAAPTDRVLAVGETSLFDFAPVIDDYWGDSCSTIVVGKADREISLLHEAVARALKAGIALLRPGVAVSDVDKKVREVMAESGYHYPHLTGHGIGLKQQEFPIILPNSDHVLQVDTVVALEPGAYFDGYGLRLEHVIHITEDGPRVLTDHGLELHSP